MNRRRVFRVHNVIDMTGARIGMLTVVDRAPDYISPSGKKKTMWQCKCDCGNIVDISGHDLRKKRVDCGCRKQERAKESLDEYRNNKMIGKTFGLLTVLGRVENYVSPKGDGKQSRWLCICKCGNTAEVLGSRLLRGKTLSCGCLQREVARKNVTKHGGRNDKLYDVWASIKQRCQNKNNKSYKYYGGRGIKMCDEWSNEYANFKQWAYANGYDDALPSKNCTIDRIDVNGDYCPENCRWVSMTTQANNKSNNIRIMYHNEEHTASEWSEILGINKSTFYGWLSDGETIESIIKNKKIKEIRHGRNSAYSNAEVYGKSTATRS